jgi:hypothetical protein
MSIIVKAHDGPPGIAPIGLHRAVCVDVIDLGLEDTEFGKKYQVQIAWQIDAKKDNGFSFCVRRRYTATLGERATLRKTLEGWLGRKLEKAELEGGFDLESLKGLQCQVLVQHQTRANGTEYARVESVLPPAKGVEPLKDDGSYKRWTEPKNEESFP